MAVVSLVERKFHIDGEDNPPVKVEQIELAIHPSGYEYLDPDQVTDLINQLEYFRAEMEKK
jgi:hypothetical protein